jgi:hypothetical protein
MGDFTIIKGDTCYITYIKLDEDGVKVNLVSGDSCTFSAKKNLKQTTYDIQVTSTTIEDGQIVIKLEQDDTNIALGEYFYDIELNEDATGDTFTVSRGTVTIDWSVTSHE